MYYIFTANDLIMNSQVQLNVNIIFRFYLLLGKIKNMLMLLSFIFFQLPLAVDYSFSFRFSLWMNGMAWLVWIIYSRLGIRSHILVYESKQHENQKILCIIEHKFELIMSSLDRKLNICPHSQMLFPEFLVR